MMGDDDIIVSTSNISAASAAPAMVHAEQSSRGALKYRGLSLCFYLFDFDKT